MEEDITELAKKLKYENEAHKKWLKGINGALKQRKIY